MKTGFVDFVTKWQLISDDLFHTIFTDGCTCTFYTTYVKVLTGAILNNKKLFLWNVIIRRVQNHNVHILYNYRIVAFANILIQFYHFTKLEGCHCGVYSLKIIMYFDDKNRNHVFLSTKQCNSVVWRSYMCILWKQTYFAFIQLWINNIRMKALVASKIRKCNIVVEL